MVVKILGVAFAALLMCAPLADLEGDAYHRPLSMFRDYDPAWIGYALFAVLFGIGVETARTAYRGEDGIQAAVYLVATALLAVVAATPSYDELHTACALVVMGLLFVNFAVLLYRGDQLFRSHRLEPRQKAGTAQIPTLRLSWCGWGRFRPLLSHA